MIKKIFDNELKIFFELSLIWMFGVFVNLILPLGFDFLINNLSA